MMKTLCGLLILIFFIIGCDIDDHVPDGIRLETIHGEIISGKWVYMYYKKTPQSARYTRTLKFRSTGGDFYNVDGTVWIAPLHDNSLLDKAFYELLEDKPELIADNEVSENELNRIKFLVTGAKY